MSSRVTYLEPADPTEEPSEAGQPRATRTGYSMAIGRVGALAMLLGIGTAAAIITAGAATADNSSASSATRSSTSSSTPGSRAQRSTSSVVPKPAVPSAAAAKSPSSSSTHSSAATSAVTAILPAASVTSSRAASVPSTTVATVPSSTGRSSVAQAAASTQTPAYFPTASWLWQPIAANPTLASNSATWVSYLSAPGGQHVADMYNYGVTLVPASAITTSTPRYSVKLSNVGAWGANPFGSATIPLPKGTMIPPGTDGQVAVLDPVTGQAYSIWQAKYNSKTNTWSGTWGGATPLSGNGVDKTGSGTGAGISRYAGVITTAEFSAAIAANTGINHALVFSSNIAGPGFVGPAIKSDGTNLSTVATPIPEGYRIQLDPSINVDAIPNITPGEKVIAKTLQTYGAYVVDQGGATMAFAFQTAPNATATNPGTAYTNAGFAWDYYNMANNPWSHLSVLAA